jgi:hypothetical protein
MKKILFALMALFVVAFIGMANAVGSAAVTGTVYYSDGTTAVDLATVTVSCTHNSAVTTLPDVYTNVAGEYNAEFDPANCGYTDAVQVHAVKDTMTGDGSGAMCNSETCTLLPVAIVDVTIPEFGLVGAMIVLLAGIGIVAYRRH